MSTRYRKILVAAALTALALTAILASAANAATPAPPYQDFAGCPNAEESEFVGDCIKYEFTGGHIGFGKRDIPVTNPIVLRGGIESETEAFVFNSEGGIVPVRQPVPGGLVGLTGYKWLDEALGSSSLLKLYATVELAGQPVNVNEPPMTLPIKLHLENPFLGEGCYVGSAANPITLHLTTGTTSPPAPNLPISGHKPGAAEHEVSRPAVLTARSGLFVDNAYSVPAASGCEFKFGPIHQSIDSQINSSYGLPSAAGNNTAELAFNVSLVLASVVYP
ncbi:MAG TPA: hypothetical protein VHS74_02845 [Solirubrobacterales bacterium]|nr:hypothetical protein [Solirubrobacterales bacterium]